MVREVDYPIYILQITGFFKVSLFLNFFLIGPIGMNLEHEEGRLTGRKERDLFFFLSSIVGKNLNEAKTSLSCL